MTEDIRQMLIALQNADAKERASLIKLVEAQGRQVEIHHLVYTIIDEQGEQHRLPKQTCPQCHTSKLLSEFFARKHVLPWCKACREIDPHGSKLAADREYQRHYPIEKRRGKEKRQKEKHPERKNYSDHQLDQIARNFACTILGEQAHFYIEQEEERYTPAQQRKILVKLMDIVQQIEHQPEHVRALEQITTLLQADTERMQSTLAKIKELPAFS